MAFVSDDLRRAKSLTLLDFTQSAFPSDNPSTRLRLLTSNDTVCASVSVTFSYSDGSASIDNLPVEMSSDLDAEIDHAQIYGSALFTSDREMINNISVATSGAEIEIDTVSVESGQAIKVVSFKYTPATTLA